MRYRPFNASGVSASAITLVLDGSVVRASDRLKLIYAALELGVNSFELPAGDPDMAEDLGHAVAAVGRRLLILTLRMGRSRMVDGEGFSPASLRADLDQALARSGLDRFDAVVLDGPGPGDLSREALDVLHQARASRRIDMVGLASEGRTADSYLASGGFDLLVTPFNLRSGWPERNRIKSAVQNGMTVIGCGYDAAAAPPGEGEGEEHRPKGLGRLFHRADPREVHAYGFLDRTPGWTSEQISLAYALTEPAVATVLVAADSRETLEDLAAAAENEMPTGVAAQIEMARFSAVA